MCITGIIPQCLCFIDVSEAFDRVNHEKLFYKLHSIGVPKYLTRILAFWYAHQAMHVQWGNFMKQCKPIVCQCCDQKIKESVK